MTAKKGKRKLRRYYTKDNPMTIQEVNQPKSEIQQLQGMKIYWQNQIFNADKGVFPSWTLGLSLVGALAGNDKTERAIAAGIGAMVGNAIDGNRRISKMNLKDKIIANAQAKIREIDKRIATIRKVEKEVIKPMQKEGVLELHPITGKLKSKKVITLSQLQDMNFKKLKLSPEFRRTIAEPAPNFFLAIYGEKGSGKSTWLMKFAEYLSLNHGTVLYNSSEEGIKASMKNKAMKLKKSNEYLKFSDATTFEELKELLDVHPVRFVFIDSINDMRITPEQLKKLRELHPKKGFAAIMQATKTGQVRGDSRFLHDNDILLRHERHEVRQGNHLVNEYKIVVEKDRFK